MHTRPPHVIHTLSVHVTCEGLRLKEESLPKVIDEETAEQRFALPPSFEESGLHLP